MDLSGYNIQGSVDSAKLMARNNLRLISLRWYYMAFLVGSAAFVTLAFTGSAETAIRYIDVLLINYAVNLLLYLAAKKFDTSMAWQKIVIGSQLLLDLVMSSVAVHLQGGIDARTTVLYAIPIVASGLAFSRELIMPVAGLSGVAYGITILLHTTHSDQTLDWLEFSVPLVFYPVLFLILGRVTMFLSTAETSDARERAYNSFLSLLAHQLKHPASASKTIIDVMHHDKTAAHTEQTKHYMDLLSGENENQIRLIDNLLEAAPRHSVDTHLEAVDIALLFEKVAHKVADSHQRLSDLAKDQGVHKPVLVVANPIKMQLALTNVFDNSFRHTPDGAHVHYSLSLNGDELTLIIRDKGVGMSKEHLAGISEKFSSSSLNDLRSGHVGGFGLGLFIANKIISAHNGTLEVQSKEGKGTTVTIRIKGAKYGKNTND